MELDLLMSETDFIYLFDFKFMIYSFHLIFFKKNYTKYFVIVVFVSNICSLTLNKTKLTKPPLIFLFHIKSCLLELVLKSKENTSINYKKEREKKCLILFVFIFLSFQIKHFLNKIAAFEFACSRQTIKLCKKEEEEKKCA